MWLQNERVSVSGGLLATIWAEESWDEWQAVEVERHVIYVRPGEKTKEFFFRNERWGVWQALGAPWVEGNIEFRFFILNNN